MQNNQHDAAVPQEMDMQQAQKPFPGCQDVGKALDWLSEVILKTDLTEDLKSKIQELSDPFNPGIAWRRRLSNTPDREPVELDVQDGRAEYLLSGPYSLGEGGKIEVIGGKLLFTGNSLRVS